MFQVWTLGSVMKQDFPTFRKDLETSGKTINIKIILFLPIIMNLKISGIILQSF